MIRAFWRTLCFCLFTALFTGLSPHPSLTATAQVGSNVSRRIAKSEPAKPSKLPEIGAGDIRPLIFPTFRYDLSAPSFMMTGSPAALLRNAITKRLGVRYRYRGTDDRGYDCSGFVWSVFTETGADYERGPARNLWLQLPAATGEETAQFGTLVFFNKLRHVGIVRDADTFYHASRRNGVKLSRFAGYWKRRITGFRRSPMAIFPHPSMSTTIE